MRHMTHPVPSFHMVHPVFVAKTSPERPYMIQGQVMGTCFSIGGRFFMTAGHVVEALRASSDSEPVIGITMEDRSVQGLRVDTMESFVGDIGILRAAEITDEQAGCIEALPWRLDVLPTFTTVRSIGYAYGLTIMPGDISLSLRGFEGCVSSSMERYHLPSSGEPPLPAYETTFQVPRGLSGAPLLLNTALEVHGVVIGNGMSRMLVKSTEEFIEEKNEKLVVEQYETLILGLARRSAWLMPIEVECMGTTVEAHLQSHGLLR
jgi:hypothetical protein